MSDEREIIIKETDDGEGADVEAHHRVKANDEKDSNDEPETPDVEGHAHVKAK